MGKVSFACEQLVNGDGKLLRVTWVRTEEKIKWGGGLADKTCDICRNTRSV